MQERVIYRARVEAEGWSKNGRALKAWREGAELRPQTLTAYGETEREARVGVMRKIVARGLAATSTVRTEEA